MSNEAFPYHAYTGRRGTYSYWLKKGVQAIDMYSNMQSISNHFPNPSDFPKEKHMYIPKSPVTPTPKSRVRKKAYAESPAVPGYSGTGPWQGIPYSLPKKNMQVDKRFKVNRPYGEGGVNQLAGRAAMRMQTKKLKSKRVAKVKVPKKLRKQIKQIMIGKNLTGKYVVSRVGNIAVASPNAAAVIPDVTLYGVVTKPAYFQTNNGATTNAYSSWFVPSSAAAAGASLDVSAVAMYNNYDALTFFHPAKFMDAASVLWNKKTVAENGWTTQTGNIHNRIDPATGAEGSYNRVSNVSFHIVNSFVEFEIKNASKRQMHVRIVTCEPKHKILSQYPLSTAVDGIAEDATENGALYAVSTQADLNNPLFNFRDSPYFSGQYKYDVMEITIKGGETCKHSLQGPKNVEFNTSKFLVNTLNGEQYNMKGTKNVIMQVLPDNQLTAVGQPGRFMEYAVSGNQYKCPIIVSRTETFVLKVPETAGFLKNDNADGEVQTLNQKRNVTAYGNFANQAYANVAYFGVDEENVAAGAIGGDIWF